MAALDSKEEHNGNVDDTVERSSTHFTLGLQVALGGLNK